VAATADFVLFSSRGLNDTADIWTCVAAADGKEVWSHLVPCEGTLDYGNSPRATPLIHEGLVYLFGAFGHLACLKLKSGEVVWELNLPEEFSATEKPKWGACSSPILVDGKLIVNPGAKEASLVALDPTTGKTVWKSPGKAAGYGSLIVGTFGGVKQIVGHDTDTLGGWSVDTGKRLWTIKPESSGDFNVPTPIEVDGKLLVATENNGTRLFRFTSEGKIDPKPVAVNRKLAPDTHSPVVIGNRVLGVWRRLFALDLQEGLKANWDSDDKAFARYTTLVATDKLALAFSLEGEMVLFDPLANEWKELGRVKALTNEAGLYSHPAFVGKRIYLRGSSSLICLEFTG
jgi:outer membrane protein assembly factor BamB